MNTNFKKIVLTGILIFITQVSFGGEIIYIGKNYPIIEMDLLDYIKTRVSEMYKNGEWQKIQEEATKRIKKKIVRPTPIDGITKATETREWIFDPTFEVSFDIKDHEGRVIIKKGEKVNPLHVIPLTKTLIFIDADDEEQIDFAKSFLKKDQKLKIILINGSIVEANEALKVPIYFDQEGKLTQKFNIKHVPAVIKQKGNLLLICEEHI